MTELVGNNIVMLVGGGQAKHHAMYLEKFNKAEKASSTIGQQRVLYSRRKDGSQFPCLIGIKQIPDTKFLVGYIRNVTGVSQQQKTVEFDNMSNLSKRSKNSSEEDLLDGSFDAVIVTDYHGVIKKINATELDLFRHESKDELLGNNISILVGGDDAKKHDMYLKNVQKTGKSSSQIGKQRVLFSRRRDGTEFPCIIGIKKTPKSEQLVSYIRDMSDVGHQENSIEITNL